MNSVKSFRFHKKPAIEYYPKAVASSPLFCKMQFNLSFHFNQGFPRKELSSEILCEFFCLPTAFHLVPFSVIILIMFDEKNKFWIFSLCNFYFCYFLCRRSKVRVLRLWCYILLCTKDVIVRPWLLSRTLTLYILHETALVNYDEDIMLSSIKGEKSKEVFWWSFAVYFTTVT